MGSFFRVVRFLGAPVLLGLLAFGQVPEPEVYSPLGKSFFAKADEARSVEKADLDLGKGPPSASLLLAAAQSRDALFRFSQSIPIYTRGMDEYPTDVQFPRFRGHRFISTRKFDFAIADLKRAAELSPASFDVSYHLALAYYLRGDYNHAAREYQRCLDMAAIPQPQVVKGLPDGWRTCHKMDDDTRVAITNWAWSALRRAGKAEDAVKLLASIHAEMKVTQNQSYFRNLLLYKGLRTEAQAVASPVTGTAGATVGYGVGLWHWVEGRKEAACAAWTGVLAEPNWATFGFIAAETEYARGACKATKKR